MANSITGVNDDFVAQRALAALGKKLLPLSVFTTDFSPDLIPKGATVSVLRETYPDQAAVVKATHTAYTIQDADSDAVEVTLGQPLYVSFALDDVERHSSSAVNLGNYSANKGNQLANDIMQDTGTTSYTGPLNLITNANFGAAAFTGAATTFDADDIADLKKVADEAEWPDDPRGLVIKSAYLTNLLKDNAIQSNPNVGGEPIREGSLGRLMGFDIFQTESIPANGENLVGFICNPSAIAIAMRYNAPDEGHTYRRAEPMTDPGTGATIGVRVWYDNDTGQTKMVLEAVAGSVVGVSACLKRIVSA